MRRIIFSILSFYVCVSVYGQNTNTPLPIDTLIKIFNHPNLYPNYVMVSAHRGYWKDVPENSAPAINAALDLGADMIELDVTRTDYSETVLYLLHDWGLDRLTTGHGVVKRRIDGEIQNYKVWNDIRYAKLKKYTGEVTNYTLLQLSDALQLCKNRALVSLDKVENIVPEMYSIVKNLGMTNQVTFKTKIATFPTPESLKRLFSSEEDKQNIVRMYTPTIFSEVYENDPQGTINLMKAFINEGVPGFEMIYFKDSDKMLSMSITVDGVQYPNCISWLRAINKRVIQFPEWPESEKGNWFPGAFRFRTIDMDGSDKRNNWDWLTQPAHCPDVIISDRLEVLFKYLEIKGKRSL